jgi:hypothetical protein
MVFHRVLYGPWLRTLSLEQLEGHLKLETAHGWGTTGQNVVLALCVCVSNPSEMGVHDVCAIGLHLRLQHTMCYDATSVLAW